MKKWKVLVTAPRALPVIGRFEEELGAAGCEVLVQCPAERLEEELLPLVGDIEGMICDDNRITSRVLDAAPRLRVISKWGTGIDPIDGVEAKRRGIAVCNTPGVFSDPVADNVLGYILLFSRRLDRMAADMRAGLWQRLPLFSLKECTLSIVGLGIIGCDVARSATVFGMRILGYADAPLPEATLNGLCVQMVSLETLLTDSNFVTLHADLRVGNRHLIDAVRLRLMKMTSILINTARGAQVDEGALITALREGCIAGAALDVFEEEPLPSDSPLRSLENVYFVPHNANASALASERVHTESIRNLLQALGAENRK